MNTLNSMITVLLVLASLTIFGQGTSQTENEKPFIEVNGTAEKEIIPNEIYIAITIKERYDKKNKISIEEQEVALQKALQDIGIPLDDLTLSDAGANYVKVKWIKKDVITKTEYTLKVRDAETVGKIFETLDELKINDAYISKVDHSDLLEFKKEVRIMAIKAAKEKSDYLLAALGEQTGKPLKISEVIRNSSFDDDSYLNTRGYRERKVINYTEPINSQEQDNSVIQFEKIKLQATIYVKFGIL